MLNLINELKKLNQSNKIPLFIAIDQEGGRVNRLPPEIKNLPTANKLATSTDLDTTIEATKITANLLKNSGFNLNFAPVLDIKNFDDKHPLGDRCYSSNKENVVKFGIPVMKEYQNNGIIPVIKHFPGHGCTIKDSHMFLPVVSSSMKELEKTHTYPFIQAIKEGCDAILVSHILIKKETGIYPASLSRKFIIKYLRKKYKFKGLIITDDLKMRSIRFIYGPVFAVEKAFQSGNDIILFRFNQKDEKRALNKIYNCVKNKKIKEHNINNSVRRILEIKEKYNISDEILSKELNIEDINNKISEIRIKAGI